ncbi:hypothetical protein Fuma_06620 [Fuerstiella marisgermanici]|uniref:Uncharacterized protein n=2 Tax=Fuerstiella marisgermanici TaxID=1891926 RepID=A0A1P8WSB2_9PLAN|nr:hypothetical protein Fuma_06620 [Fuerstiella marisgermanici]
MVFCLLCMPCFGIPLAVVRVLNTGEILFPVEAEEECVVADASQRIRRAPFSLGRPVLRRSPIRRTPTLSIPAICVVAGHRLANGLLAPMLR